MERIGLFGGSFNPIHLGHLLIAQTAREEFRLDRLFFIPAAQSPWKPHLAPAPAKARLRLMRLALAGQPDCEIDDQEIQRGGVSYTIETAREYTRRFPASRRFYLIGADHAATLPKWRDAAELAGLIEFLIVPRPGQVPATLPPPFRGSWLSGFPLAVSSSQIRERIRAGLPIDLLAGPTVAAAIRELRLYL
jgi:nicotinate-nucleotide adenylyltransferase